MIRRTAKTCITVKNSYNHKMCPNKVWDCMRLVKHDQTPQFYCITKYILTLKKENSGHIKIKQQLCLRWHTETIIDFKKRSKFPPKISEMLGLNSEIFQKNMENFTVSKIKMLLEKTLEF